MNEVEVQRAISEANNGNWIPFGIVIGLLVVIILMFIYILKTKEKALLDHNKKTDRSFEKLAEISAEMKTMLAVHDNELKQLKGVA